LNIGTIIIAYYFSTIIGIIIGGTIGCFVKDKRMGIDI